MKTNEIAARLVELCRQGQFETAQKELFSNDAVSIEPREGMGFEKETKGIDAIIEKGHKFNSMVEEMHGVEVSEPVVADHSFAISMMLDATMKGRERSKMTEICLYKVQDGKIVSEEFIM